MEPRQCDNNIDNDFWDYESFVAPQFASTDSTLLA